MKGTTVSIRVTHEELAQIKALARQNLTSVATLIRQSLDLPPKEK
ncbi:hypothetical protein NIES2100_73870 [Calothrix sp. NIES-2100]|nr:hypothetical protein NIES2100_73870 [Calothrix sp. NIES-2100]